MIEILLPGLGEDIVSGTIITVPVETGAVITAGQTLFEIETDKVTVEIPANIDGVIVELFAQPGDDVAIGDKLATIEPKSNKNSTPTPRTSATDKTPSKMNHRATGTIKPTAEAATPQAAPLRNPVQSAPRPGGSPHLTPAGPAARRMARELGVDIHTVPGSGLRNRICKQDVITFAKQLLQKTGEKIQAGSASPLPYLNRFGDVESTPLDNIQRATARNMARAWREIPHAWMQQEIDVTELEEKRQQLKTTWDQNAPSLTITPFIIKAMAISMGQHPLFNASIDIANDQIIQRHYIDIGVAVDTPRGLVAPVIRAVEKLSPQNIADKIADLSARAQQNRLLPEELQGAGITLSNLGHMGLSSIQPIINWPQSSIVGTAATHWSQQKNADGQWQERLLLPLTLAFDHRLINGADAARFVAAIKTLLEDPRSLTSEKRTGSN